MTDELLSLSPEEEKADCDSFSAVAGSKTWSERMKSSVIFHLY